MLVGGLLSLLHGVVVIHFQADQVVSGLSLTFLGTGLSLVFGEGLSKAGAISLLPIVQHPAPGPDSPPGPDLVHRPERPGLRRLSAHSRRPGSTSTAPGPGLHLRAVGEYPAAADALGISVYRLRYLYVFVGGVLAGLAGATISLAISPGWFSELTTSGQGWIAIGLVIFAQWNPLRAAVRRLCLWRAAPPHPGPARADDAARACAIPSIYNPYLGFFLQMLPYAFTIVVLVIGSREAMRKRLGAPAALGVPYVRSEKG